ncbi:hypothetical protein IFM89_029809 [Coptis chinensis]|uniref:Uncharacterized protein n=1 Tax=Coptis chinensis TaxID=261450 RepID=A0A835HKK3_9MAGN|nr:hypothetical protein IFM89_029809 [Coptis chinensis]
MDGMEGRRDEDGNTTTELKRKECSSPPLTGLENCDIMEISTSICPENTIKVCTSDLVKELKIDNYEKSKAASIVVGSSNRTEGVDGWKRRWQNIYNISGGSGNMNSCGDTTVSKNKEPIIMDGGEEVAIGFHPGSLRLQNLPLSRNKLPKNVLHTREKPVKHLRTSGFSQFFSKNSILEKGVDCDRFGPTSMRQNDGKEACVTVQSVNCSAETDQRSPLNVSGSCPVTPVMYHEGINLREWLKPGLHKVNKAERLHMFTQIVKIVDVAHSQQVALQDVRPSCFELLPSNRVKYVGSLASRELVESGKSPCVPYLGHHLSRKRSLEVDINPYNSLYSKHQKVGENTKVPLQHTQSLSSSATKFGTVEAVHNSSIKTEDSGSVLSKRSNLNPTFRARNRSGSPNAPNFTCEKTTSIDFELEDKWYACPEELSGSCSTFSSNIYSLGVLLFELLCCFESLEVHDAALSDLHNRILPPNFLSENPKETGFCLWLLHPEPSSRPTTRKIFQSGLICGSQELSSRDQLSAPADEDDAESELLLHFLTTLKDEKQKKASRLVKEIGCLEADLKEVAKRHLSRTGGTQGWSYKEPASGRDLLSEPVDLDPFRSGSSANKIGTALTRNISQLESAYFSVRSQMQIQDRDSTARSDKHLIKDRDRWPSAQNENEDPIDRLGTFFDGLCKYARYSKFEQRAVLRTSDILNSANVICSLSFDRDEDYFAAAGVSKKIKIFEYHALLNDSVDIHYPVIEMTSKSKLSCVCWNNYIKNYLASTDYDGDVQLWDASTGQVFAQYMEHERRAWSADFSQVDPKKLASGSDDGLVKLWNINEQKSISTIRNVANVCCVQFSAHSTNLLAFGSADYNTYCYDIRSTRVPWCTLSGHGKTVSYVKFLDSETLISASTDNTLKLWDLNRTSSTGLSTSACSLTFSGHTNEKNFVGLSVSDGYIACGSETNEVYAYHRSLPMPITSCKFGSIDPISGRETDDDNGQFVSSVCWRGKSNTVVTANSTGSIKLLQLVE